MDKLMYLNRRLHCRRVHWIEYVRFFLSFSSLVCVRYKYYTFQLYRSLALCLACSFTTISVIILFPILILSSSFEFECNIFFARTQQDGLAKKRIELKLENCRGRRRRKSCEFVASKQYDFWIEEIVTVLHRHRPSTNTNVYTIWNPLHDIRYLIDFFPSSDWIVWIVSLKQLNLRSFFRSISNVFVLNERRRRQETSEKRYELLWKALILLEFIVRISYSNGKMKYSYFLLIFRSWTQTHTHKRTKCKKSKFSRFTIHTIRMVSASERDRQNKCEAKNEINTFLQR